MKMRAGKIKRIRGAEKCKISQLRIRSWEEGSEFWNILAEKRI
jgi:hypothetical protein